MCLNALLLIVAYGFIMFRCGTITYHIFWQINATIRSSKFWKDNVAVGSGWTPWNSFAGI